MSTIVQLRQGSPEWLAYRQGMRNASESAAVLGLSPWVTPHQLWLQKTGRVAHAANAAMQHGTEMEPLARHAYEVETGNVMQPLVLQDGPYSASLDGMTLDGDLIVEIKCPVRGQKSSLWATACEGQVPPCYQVQIQHQLMVSGAQRAHLWVFDGQSGLLVPVDRDEGAMGDIRSAWETFEPYLLNDTPPPLADRDTRIRDDAPWLTAALSYQAAKREADLATERLDCAKQALLALSSHARESGAGVTVTRFWKQGPVDYKRVPELREVDLNAYRGKTREEARITLGD